MRKSPLSLSVAMMLASTMLWSTPGLCEEQPAQPTATMADDYLEVEGCACQLYLPGEWALFVEPDPSGVYFRGHTKGGQVEFHVQTVVGKETATPEALKNVFEQYMANKTKPLELEETEQGLRGRYIATIEGESVVLKALFKREGTTSWMVYVRAVMSEVQQDPQVDSLMDSILNSFKSAPGV